jgi:hypothetical protein
MTRSGAGIGSEFGISAPGGYQIDLFHPVRFLTSSKVSFVANGRAAMGLAIRHLRQTAGSWQNRVLLPAYLCRSMIQPFIEHGLRFDFYSVTDCLSIDPVEVVERVDDATLAVLLMHYFGFSQSAGLASVIANQCPQVAILDDRTHMLGTDLGTEVADSAMEIRLYSPRKWGPFPDLGLVIWPPAAKVSRPRSRLLDGGYDLGFALWRLTGGFLRALYFALPLEKLRRMSLHPFHRAEALLDRRVRVCRSSPISRLLWHYWKWIEVWRIRRDNFRYLLDNWAQTEIEPLYSELPDRVCPVGFPVRTSERDGLRLHLISEKIYPPIHWVRPAEVSVQDFPQEAALAEQELTIPIDQRYTRAHMDSVLEALCRR